MVYLFDGTPIAEDYIRIVYGGRGNYVEFSDDHIIKENIHIPDNQKWRQLPQYHYVFYDEWRSNSEGFVKLYHQRKLVNYADYQIGKWYIAEKDCLLGEK